MRTDFGAHIQRQLHFIERPLKIGDRHRADYGAAFVADDIRQLSADHPSQASATLRIPKVGVRKHGFHDPYCSEIQSLAR
jgi:hypothetical protein